MPFSTPMMDEHGGEGAPEPLGARLKALREARGLSIDEVVAATNIPADKIEAIEGGTIVGSAPTAYARGFVRLYAEYLDADVEAAMEELDRVGRPERARLYLRGLGQMSHKDYRPSRRREDRRAVRAVLWVLLVLAVLALVYYGWERLGRWLESMDEQASKAPPAASNGGAGPDGSGSEGTESGVGKPAYALDIVALENAPYEVEVDGVLIVPDEILAKGKSYRAEGHQNLRITLREPAKVRVLENGEPVALDLGTKPVVLVYDEGGLHVVHESAPPEGADPVDETPVAGDDESPADAPAPE